MRLKWIWVTLGLALFSAGVVWQVSEGLQRLPDVDFSALVTPSRMVTTTRRATPLPPGSTPPPATATLPFSLSVDELMAIQSLPSALEDTIGASMGWPSGLLRNGQAPTQGVEIIRAFRSSKRPFNPNLPYPHDLYCITLNPEVTITLYVQDYVPIQGSLLINSADDYEPGATRRGRMDRFVALQRERGGGWELYHPDVFPWRALCT